MTIWLSISPKPQLIHSLLMNMVMVPPLTYMLLLMVTASGKMLIKAAMYGAGTRSEEDICHYLKDIDYSGGCQHPAVHRPFFRWLLSV